MQEVDFDYEIVITEDASTDGTREIISGLRQLHRDRIRLLFRDPSVAERDRARGVGGKTSFMEGLRACRGQYVALLDGDDYWTAPHKLQRQVDFLDGHPDFSMCFHNAWAFFQDGSNPPYERCPPDQKEVVTLEDLISGNFIPACSVMFRRWSSAELPDWFATMPTGDWALNVLNAAQGKVGYINEVMAGYRIHGGSFWAMQDYFTCLEKEMEIFEVFNRHFNYRYQRVISSTLAKRCQLLAEEYERRGDLGKAKTYALRCLVERIRDRQGPSFLPFMLLRLHSPTFYGILRSLKRTFTVRSTSNMRS